MLILPVTLYGKRSDFTTRQGRVVTAGTFSLQRRVGGRHRRPTRPPFLRIARDLARIHAMLASCGSLAYAPPPMYNISAVSLRDAGLQQGRLARERIRGWLGTTEMTELAEYAITGEGQAAFRQLKADNTRFAPLLVGELEGVASGAEVRTSRTSSGTVPRPHLVTLTLAVTVTVAVAAGASRPDLGRHDDQ